MFISLNRSHLDATDISIVQPQLVRFIVATYICIIGFIPETIKAISIVIYEIITKYPRYTNSPFSKDAITTSRPEEKIISFKIVYYRLIVKSNFFQTFFCIKKILINMPVTHRGAEHLFYMVLTFFDD